MFLLRANACVISGAHGTSTAASTTKNEDSGQINNGKLRCGLDGKTL